MLINRMCMGAKWNKESIKICTSVAMTQVGVELNVRTDVAG